MAFRMKSHQDREYVSSVTLLVLGEDLNPDKASAELRLEPSQSWRKDGRSIRLRDGTTQLRESAHAWGGWKMFIADAHIFLGFADRSASAVEIVRIRMRFGRLCDIR